MAIRIVPYECHLAEQTIEFNRRLHKAGAAPFLLPETAPGDTPPLAGACGIAFHHFLAVDNSGAVRGGFFIRTQPVVVRGQIHTVGHYTAPLSEGLIDKRYAAVGALLLAHALKFQPLLFAMGMGGMQNPLPRMLKGMGWTIYEVPFFFRAVNGSQFFRHLGPLHTSRARSLMANALAASGLGHAGISVLQRIRTRASFDRRFEISTIDEFGSWTDELWRQTSVGCSFSAVRDAAYLRFLYSADENCCGIRLNEAGKTRGWVELMHCRPRNASFFGGMRVMGLIDGIAAPEAIPSLVLAAIEHARGKKADLIFSNQMHSDWTAALRECGFLQGPSNYLLALSKDLARLLDPLSESAGRIHFNRGDGDGRVNLRK